MRRGRRADIITMLRMQNDARFSRANIMDEAAAAAKSGSDVDGKCRRKLIGKSLPLTDRTPIKSS